MLAVPTDEWPIHWWHFEIVGRRTEIHWIRAARRVVAANGRAAVRVGCDRNCGGLVCG